MKTKVWSFLFPDSNLITFSQDPAFLTNNTGITLTSSILAIFVIPNNYYNT